MSKKLSDQLKIKTILEKVESKLKTIVNDPDVISYNYYNDSKFVGAKVMRNKKITLEQVADDLATLSKTVANLTKLVIEGFTEQKKFNAEQRLINEEQKKYNKKIDKIEKLVELMAETPTMKKELAALKKKK